MSCTELEIEISLVVGGEGSHIDSASVPAYNYLKRGLNYAVDIFGMDPDKRIKVDYNIYPYDADDTTLKILGSYTHIHIWNFSISIELIGIDMIHGFLSLLDGIYKAYQVNIDKYSVFLDDMKVTMVE